MLKEKMLLQEISYDMGSEDAFYGVLSIMKDLTLPLDSIDYSNKVISIAGNIKVDLKDDILKQTALSNRIGLFIAFLLMATSDYVYLDRLIISVKGNAIDNSELTLHGRINYGNMSSRMYSKSFDVDFKKLLEKLGSYGVRLEDCFIITIAGFMPRTSQALCVNRSIESVYLVQEKPPYLGGYI